MTQLHMITSQQALQVSVLRKYFQQNSISKKLSLRVLRNARKAAAEQQRFMPEESVELLALVSDPLRVELHFEMFSPILHVHHFFKQYIDECPQVMRKVCHSAIIMSAASPGDTLFHNGEIPKSPMMYFVVSGALKYVTSIGESHSIGHGDWLSEGTLWTPWMHRGNLEAVMECRLCKIDSKKFQEVVTQFEHPGFNPKQRAEFFVRQLNTLGDDGELTDLDPILEDEVLEESPSVTNLGTLARHMSRRTSHLFFHHGAHTSNRSRSFNNGSTMLPPLRDHSSHLSGDGD